MLTVEFEPEGFISNRHQCEKYGRAISYRCWLAWLTL